MLAINNLMSFYDIDDVVKYGFLILNDYVRF